MRARTSAIIIGAGIAGLATARVLSDHVDEVRILERDRLPQRRVPRPSVPQGRHAHALLEVGERLLDTWFPGLTAELEAGGAVTLNAAALLGHQSRGRRVLADPGSFSLSTSRPLLEGTIRALLTSQRDAVSVGDETAVDGLLVEDGRVTGVEVDGVRHRADLVVACTGRHTRFLDQLAEKGFSAPPMSEVDIGVTCGTCVVSRRPDDFRGALAVAVDDPVAGHRIGMMVPAEGNLWIVSLASSHSEEPSAEPSAFEAFARSMPLPLIAEVLARGEVVTPVMTYRMPVSRRRHVERLTRPPAGFLVLGDAVCSFNPLHAQGVSSAALQAQALGNAVARHGPSSAALPRDFYRRVARIIDVPWRIAAQEEAAVGDGASEPAGTDLLDRYLGRALRAGRTCVPVARQALRVRQLRASPATLMTPAMILRVLLSGYLSPARTR
ncbi:FAD-dependent monooxygenase [Lentzea sp. NPDC034063]|uniref:NAD(P)/FAD-dependent oxidoreductase n=1 Tax=unclassified Lentzea TaxID=2643253 RepID=UPI0033D4D4F1